MRILHVFDHSIPLHSGYTFRSYQILREQRALGYETRHVTSIKHLNPEGAEETVEDLHFFRTTRYNKIFAKLPVINQYEVVRSLKKRLREILKNEKVDVIQAHSPMLNGMAAVAVGKEFNIPVLYEIRAFWEDAAVSHGSCKEGDLRYRMTRDMETKVAREADAVTVICNGLKQDLVSRGIPAEKITLIPNAVDIAKFSGSHEPDKELRSRLGLDGAVVLGFIGSFYDYEGIEILLQALPRIRRNFPEVKILLVGGGPEEDNLKQLVEAYNIEKHVMFTGRVPHDKVQDYYNQVDIFVYPRKKMRLTDLVTPLKPLEAMAQHKLVAASDIGGHNELIEDGKTGVLFAPDSPKDLAQTIINTLENRDKWPDIIAAGRHYVEEVRNWKNSIANYPAVFDRITQNKPAKETIK
ncbi:TIGR04063 family PEP-CTERM/XrtA system glycosyltransferase [Paremcibacter congregatus]|uniref:Glycosyltransferase, exosortase A system-associated n=1 Tax=Paremcibacter congregatus TaxID=2043170 RepID=A0A2G4YQM7_9PROT|nr:TIGR04063 family PEP-CTERM/XrtA system glycosyltransferase [Paremcibacter congregatus]PHZ83756.1 glycosyltransferase, exosortase A system-associated [Paremcibacter congregatus]QDE27457.1 glycosyltransferase, exosortase A system-associated [Paremcibacter congregatus]